MKPYYKKNGFFDRLDTFSRWFDYHYDVYGILYFVPWLREMAMSAYWIAELEIDLKLIQQDLEEAKENYNREKYWWMRAK